MGGAIMAAAMLAACGLPGARGPVARLTVSTSEAQVSYAFARGKDGLSKGEQSHIAEFLGGFGLTGRDILVVSIPAGGRPGSDDRRLQAMNRLLSAWPARRRFVLGGEAGTPVDTGIIRILRAMAVAADCHDGAGAAGCASARNLAAQIGDPVDALMPERRNRYLPSSGAGPGAPSVPSG